MNSITKIILNKAGIGESLVSRRYRGFSLRIGVEPQINSVGVNEMTAPCPLQPSIQQLNGLT